MRSLMNYLKELNDSFHFTATVPLSIALIVFLCVLDNINGISFCLFLIPEGYRPFIFIGIAVLLVCWGKRAHLCDSYHTPCINFFDPAVFILLATDLGYSLVTFSVQGGSSYRQYLGVPFAIILVLLIVYRAYRYFGENIDGLDSQNVYDLYNIYNGDFETDDIHDKPILVSDSAVDYDLLGRDTVVNMIIKSLTSVKDKQSYVIGIEGEWGSGKTTIINNVKKKLEEADNKKLVFCDFDPWQYGTQESLLLAMYDIILQSLGIHNSALQSRNMLRIITETISDAPYVGGLFRGVFHKNDSTEEVADIVDKLSALLEKSEKTYVFFIDNLDRADSDNVIFLFKLIETFLNLPHVIYVLAYDRRRIDKIFETEEKIAPKFIEKIVQQEIHVPAPNRERLQNVYDHCMSNILSQYGIQDTGLQEYRPIYQLICTEVQDLRKFKRMINSAFTLPYSIENYLNKKELLSLEIINFLEPNLYREIRDHREFFISHDKLVDTAIMRDTGTIKNFNEAGKSYFDDLKEKYPSYFGVLSDLFPYVNRYENNQELTPETRAQDMQYGNISRLSSICSAKYFDLYFSYGSNYYLDIKKIVNTVIDAIKSHDNEADIEETIKMVLTSIKSSDQKEWFSQFSFYMDDIPDNKRIFVAKALTEDYDIIDSSDEFMALNAQQWATSIVEALIEKMRIDDAQRYYEFLSDQYDKLWFIHEILYWFEHTGALEDREQVKEKEQLLRMTYASMCSKIISSSINLYESNNYREKNIFGLFANYKDTPDADNILSYYMNKCLSITSVYRILADAMGHSVGRTYNYSISKESIEGMYLSESEIDGILRNRPPESESEEFVLRVYNQYKSGIKGIDGRCDIESTTEVKLKL